VNRCVHVRSSNSRQTRTELEKTLRLSATPWMHNPLLLTWIVATYLRDGYIPREEVDLQDAIFNMTLGSREIYRRIVRARNAGSDEISDGALFLAYWMKSSAERVTGVTEDQMITALTSVFAYAEAAAREVVAFISDQLGLV
jgi:hypothetical protein